MADSYGYFGRRVIYSDVSQITDENIASVLELAFATHQTNSGEIQYLYDYYRGKTPILGKTKEVRPEINHRVNVNRAQEIVGFKMGYTFGEPIGYIRRGKGEGTEVEALNDYMYAVDKDASDKELAEWLHIAGVGIRMVLPSKDDESPFDLYTLDPRYAFVVYHSGLGEKPLMGVKYVVRTDGSILFSIYTDAAYYEVVDITGEMRKTTHVMGFVPMVEYQLNKARTGAFEIVLPLLDAINEIESNRLDDIEQFVNAFMALTGCEMDEPTLKKFRELKMICLPEGGTVNLVTSPMQQGDIQTMVDSIYQNVLTICGMPNRNGGGASTSDTGAAVQLRDGWSTAEANAKNTELTYKRSEKQLLRNILTLCPDIDLKARDIEIKFSRRNTDNLQSKVQALTGMLEAGVAPEIAIATCGLWNDPLDVVAQSKKYLTKWELDPPTKEDDITPTGGVKPDA